MYMSKYVLQDSFSVMIIVFEASGDPKHTLCMNIACMCARAIAGSYFLTSCVVLVSYVYIVHIYPHIYTNTRT